MVREDVELHYTEKYAKIETPAMQGKKSATIIHYFDKVKCTLYYLLVLYFILLVYLKLLHIFLLNIINYN